ncbi:cysteine desulfurase [Mycobacterium lehmannii]|uniref:Cysteine desulfurase n=1 Tax=Mycobacterium lehmannii TaxID=2048550 RepID=A0A101A851_9MYCO|nr:cysteine desulfurase family protein [Mycobacterium lehmannii]KUI17017.1 cysteine desulfurase [Mycobacterium lehmannii]
MVYLDYNASTPVDPRILPGMIEAFDSFGNPSSLHHRAGQMAAELIEEARGRVAQLVGRPAQNVIFTSGASEAAALALLGSMLGAQNRPNIVVSSTEHKAILEAAELGARLSGGQVRYVRVDRNGVLDLNEFQRVADFSVSVVAVMAANNETGVLGPLSEVANIAKRQGALVLVDATQLVGKGSLAEVSAVADLFVISSHKIYGPKGAGALVADRHTQKLLVPVASGGGQERGLRGGTQNTPAIVGFGLAAELALKEQTSDTARMNALVEKLLAKLRGGLDEFVVNGAGVPKLCNTLNVRFVGADAEAVMASMSDVEVSAGSACQSAVSMPSHVLLAMGMTGHEASESLRISLGRPTTEDDVIHASRSISAAVTRVREMASDY